VWRSVQEDCPSCSTSGGQFGGGSSEAEGEVNGEVLSWVLVRVLQEEKEVQLRHL
jgi:hypothetical protein